jgi:hypothetical protein
MLFYINDLKKIVCTYTSHELDIGNVVVVDKNYASSLRMIFRAAPALNHSI